MIEHGAFAFGHRFQSARKVGEVADVVTRDTFIVGRLIVVRGAVVRLAHAEKGIEQTGEVAAEQEGRDAGLVGLKREGDDVAHEAHVFADVFGQAVIGAVHGDHRPAASPGVVGGFLLNAAHAVHALFHLAHAVEIFVELGMVGGADLSVEASGVLLDAVEDTLGATAAAVFKQAVERERRVDLHRDGRVRVLPRDVRTVGHREIRLVITGDGLFAAEDETGLSRLVAEARREDLIHADAAVEDGALGERQAGEEITRHAGVDADARGGAVVEAADDIQLGAKRLQRLQRFAQLHLGPGALGPPMLAVDAIAHEHGGESLRIGRRRIGGCGRRCRAPHGERLQPRERHHDTRAAQKRSPGNLVADRGGGVLINRGHGRGGWRRRRRRRRRAW